MVEDKQHQPHLCSNFILCNHMLRSDAATTEMLVAVQFMSTAHHKSSRPAVAAVVSANLYTNYPGVDSGWSSSSTFSLTKTNTRRLGPCFVDGTVHPMQVRCPCTKQFGTYSGFYSDPNPSTEFHIPHRDSAYTQVKLKYRAIS